jgi:hypothetical protein
MILYYHYLDSCSMIIWNIRQGTASDLFSVCRKSRFLPNAAMSLECGSLLPPWSRYKGASKLARSKDIAVVGTQADSHFQLHPYFSGQLTTLLKSRSIL